SSSLRLPHSRQKRTRSFTSSIAPASASASSFSVWRRWKASRCAVRLPMPGRRVSCATRFSTEGLSMRPEGTRLLRTSPGKISRMGDPVSWLMIRPGWKVYGSDGTEVGEVDEVTGDDNADIFDGLAVARSTFAKPTYVPAESVGAITEERIELTLTTEQVDGLGEYLEPASSEIIEPDD